MKWLLVIYLVTSETQAVVTETFTNEQNCKKVGSEVIAFIEETSDQWTGSNSYKCLKAHDIQPHVEETVSSTQIV